jgi:hypothetical protein
MRETIKWLLLSYYMEATHVTKVFVITLHGDLSVHQNDTCAREGKSLLCFNPNREEQLCHIFTVPADAAYRLG